LPPHLSKSKIKTGKECRILSSASPGGTNLAERSPRFTSKPFDHEFFVGHRILLQVVNHSTARFLPYRLIVHFERHPLVIAHPLGVAAKGSFEALQVETRDSFQIGDRNPDDTARTGNTKAVSEKSLPLGAGKVFQQMGMIDHVEFSAWERNPATQIPRAHSRTPSSLIDIDPSGMNARSATEVQGLHCPISSVDNVTQFPAKLFASSDAGEVSSLRAVRTASLHGPQDSSESSEAASPGRVA
jgi:hypothetical protein